VSAAAWWSSLGSAVFSFTFGVRLPGPEE